MAAVTVRVGGSLEVSPPLAALGSNLQERIKAEEVKLHALLLACAVVGLFVFPAAAFSAATSAMFLRPPYAGRPRWLLTMTTLTLVIGVIGIIRGLSQV